MNANDLRAVSLRREIRHALMGVLPESVTYDEVEAAVDSVCVIANTEFVNGVLAGGHSPSLVKRYMDEMENAR